VVNFYVKNDSDTYTEATEDQINELFKERSDKIVSSKLKSRQEKIRAEVEAELRGKMSDTIKDEVRKELEVEYEAKLEKSESKAQELDIKLRRKAIAAEYGFKPEAEKFLGSGTDEEMRAEADTLKNSFKNTHMSSDGKIEKQTDEPANTGCVALCS